MHNNINFYYVSLLSMPIKGDGPIEGLKGALAQRESSNH